LADIEERSFVAALLWMTAKREGPSEKREAKARSKGEKQRREAKARSEGEKITTEGTEKSWRARRLWRPVLAFVDLGRGAT
jgi:hypothetical protein